MPCPNPLGFYSLEFAPEIETELMGGDFAAIADLISELATQQLPADQFEFSTQISPEDFDFSSCFSDAVDQAISDLMPSQQIALIRWAAERLEWLTSRRESND